jgi:ribonuclease HI
MNYHIYTDGGCSPNPGDGGYAFIVLNELENVVYSMDFVAESQTTNNQMELKAFIAALDYCAKYPKDFFEIFMDSNYVYRIYNDWIDGWHYHNWTKANGEPVKNLELIKYIYEVKHSFRSMNYILTKVKGHSKCIGNNIVDRLCTFHIDEAMDMIKANNIVIKTKEE